MARVLRAREPGTAGLMVPLKVARDADIHGGAEGLNNWIFVIHPACEEPAQASGSAFERATMRHWRVEGCMAERPRS